MKKEDLQKHLFTGRTHVYAVLDGASIDGLRQKLFEMSPPHYCLFRGKLEDDVAEMAPYVVGLISGSEFSEWLLSAKMGKHWGIYAQSRSSMRDMRQHFRNMFQVYDESGKPMLFRFYDPRVIASFLPTCNGGELASFFGSVDAYFAESTNGESINQFTLENNTLKKTELN